VRDALGAVQSVLVLGGTSEIGVATARALVARRARTVVLACRDPRRAQSAAEMLRAAGATTVEGVRFDADDCESHAALVDELFDRHGDVDLVLVTFGALGDPERAATDGEAAAALVRTNLLGAVSVAIPVVRRLQAQGHGTIVALSSVAGERVRKSNFVYGSSKAGMDAFAQGLGDSLADSGVQVMVVRPGFVKTKMTEGLDPAPLSTDPDSVAESIVGGLRRNAHTVWSPLPLRFVMSALRHLPRPLFRRLNV
jgi:decaprenylphospho-beta-D-erythro-pentofuranosid-2-ulose 2-reductase